MATASAVRTGSAASLALALEEVREFLNSLQRPHMADTRWVQGALARCQALQVRLVDTGRSAATRSQELSGAIEGMVDGLKEWSREFRDRPRKQRVHDLARRLTYRYEAMVEAAKVWKGEVRLSSQAPISVKPINYSRNLFHVSMGAFAILSYEVLFSLQVCIWIMVALAAVAVTMETVRRFIPRFNAFMVERVFGAISRPAELYHVNSASWYVMAVLIVLIAFPIRAAELGVIVLAVADPAATLVGRRWGKRRIWRDKSLVGSSAFFVTATLLAFGFASIIPDAPGIGVRLVMASVVGLVGTIAEMFSERLDDNFTIPVLCAGVASFWWLAL